MGLETLRRMIERRDIDTIASIISQLESNGELEEAEKMLNAFYEKEVQVANVVLNIELFSKIYREKIRPPLKGCYSVGAKEYL
jgi:hypothetical protein